MKRPAAALICALVVSAVAAGVASAALLALGIGLVLLTGAAWIGLELSARWVKVERTLSSSELQEDAPVALRFTVKTSRWLPVQVEVEDHSGGWMAVRDGKPVLELGVGRPGAYWLAPSRIRLRDPISVFERRIVAGRPEPLLILPAPQGGSISHLRHAGLIDDPEPEGLRPYAPGTPIGRIHWPTLAKGAGLQVRHFAPPDGLPLVVVDNAGAASSAALDWTARTAAGYILTLALKGGCRVLLPGDVNATSVVGSGAAWRAVHRRLATLGDLVPRVTSAPVAGTAAVRVRAATAPETLEPAPRLPERVVLVTKCPSGCL